MTLSTVTWRQAVAAIAATIAGLLAVIVVVRADGLTATDAASASATAWYVHQPTGRVVLVDGYRGSALGSIDTGVPGEQISVVDGESGAFVLNDVTAEARPIDTVELRLGTPFGLAALGDGQAVAGVGQSGLVVVNPATNDASVVPADGEPVNFSADTGAAVQIAVDGAIWSLADGDLVRTTSSGSSTTQLDLDNALLTMVGSEPVVVDAQNRRVRFGAGGWHPLPTETDPSEIVAQAPGPAASCGWVGADDDLWCIGPDGVEETASIEGLDIDGADLLAIAGDAAVVVRRGPSSIVRLDWRTERILEDLPTTVSADAALSVTATTDLVWIDDTAGDFVWAVNPWSIEAIDKNAQGILVLGEDGEVVEEGESRPGEMTAPSDQAAIEPEVREPDANGIDDPPVAVDDPVTARSGASVPVEVTANDYDPDGEAVAVSEVGVAGHGSIDIGTATTVVYTPEPGYVGTDEFEYTIVDGNGTSATATVRIELLSADSANAAPLGVVDHAETGAGVGVVIDVLLNDVDPERDALRIDSFSPPDAPVAASIGEVTETKGDSGLPALHFVPAEGFEGTAIFSYRPVDALDAIGDDVEVRVEVARSDDPNRPPVTRPDAVRLRRNVATPVRVMFNDTDPDGDELALTIVEPLAEGLDVDVEGDQLAVTARAGAAPLVPFEYELDDGHGHVVRGAVLVGVIDDVEPNRPPVVSADGDKVVVGESVVIDVTANDVDPDGDPLSVVSISQPAGGRGRAAVFSRSSVQFTPAALTNSDGRQSSVRFTYTVSDGNGHEVVGEVAVTVLPEALLAAPFARDDSTFTYVDVPVTVDVLRNDGNPSGGRPTLAGTPGCPAGGRATVTTDSQIRLDPPPGVAGSFRCNYEVTNESGARASAAIIVSVREREIQNEPPRTQNDFVSVEVGTSVSVDVTENDTDPDGPAGELTVVSSTAPVIGTAQRSGNVITFAAGSRPGLATINYQVADAGGAVSLGRLQVTVTERQNVEPIAAPDAQTVFAPSGPTQFGVLANDSDPDNTPGGLAVVSASLLSGNGAVTVSGNTVTITPDPGFLGQVVASYVVRDGQDLRATSTATLTVREQPNRPPDARDDANDVANGGRVSTAVLFNDVDADGDALSLSIVSGPDPALGTASIGFGQSIEFAAVPGAAGTAVISYRVSDGQFSDDAALRITVHPCAESAPVARSGFLQTGYRQPIAVDLSAFGSNGSIVDISGPAGYDGSVYTPPAGENGNVVIDYSVVNVCGMRATGQVTIDVNQDPSAQPVAVQAYRGEERVIPVSDLASDAEQLRITDSSGAPRWVSTREDVVTLRPLFNVDSGSYSWTITVTDPGGLSTTVPVTVELKDRPPVANPDTIDLGSTSPVTVDIVDNDTDPSGPASQLTIHDAPPSSITFANGETGTVTVLGDGRSVRIDRGQGAGAASFTYSVRSVTGEVSAPATVTVVGPSDNHPPTATSQNVAVTVGQDHQAVLQVSDPDGDPLTVQLIGDPGGVVAGTNGVTLTVRAASAGTFVVTYSVSDGTASSAEATVTVTASAPPASTSVP